jgi:toxin CptA
MKRSRRCCAPSPPCRFDWQPSPLIAAGLLAGTLLALASLLLSDLPPHWRLPACVAVASLGVLRTRRWLGQAPRQLRIHRPSAALWVDGVAAAAVRVSWRTGVLVLRWHAQGAVQRCLFLPGQLSPVLVRELRQWPRHHNHSPGSAAVAP